jgi:hypothetical protein
MLHPFLRLLKCTRSIFIISLLVMSFQSNAFAEALTVNLVPVDADKKVLIPYSGISDSWRSDPEFDDSEWLLCSGEPGGIGFDGDGDYNEDLSLNVRDFMGGNTSCYVRAEFNLSQELLQSFDYLALKIRYDDGFAAFINGEPIAHANADVYPSRWSHASQPHEAQSFLTFDVSENLGALKAGNNVLAIHGLNVSSGSPDFFIAISLVGRKNYRENFRSNIPIIVLDTENGNTIATSHDIQASMGIIAKPAGDNGLTSAYNDFTGDMLISKENSVYEYNKPNYRILSVNDQDASLMGMKAGNSWVLSSSYSDKTLLRDVIIGTLAHKMGRLSNAPRLCHVFVNNDYKGIYVLKENRNRHPNRINIAENEVSDISGGYILNMTGDYKSAGVFSKFPPFYNSDVSTKYQFVYPTNEAISSEQVNFITSFIHDFETALNDNDMNSVFENYIDLPSFVDYFILNEIAKNLNAYRNKTTFYKNQDSIDHLLHIEPIFDFEHTLGNLNYFNGDLVDGWVIDFLVNDSDARADSLNPPFWWSSLRNDSVFKGQVSLRWNSLYPTIFTENAIVNSLDSLYSILEDERVLNFERWGIIGMQIEPNSHVGESYDEDFDFLYVWLIDRIDWMNNVIKTYQTSVRNAGSDIVNFNLLQNYPNPFNPTTRIQYNLVASGYVDLVVYNIRGEQVATLVKEQQSAGQHWIEWNADSFPGGLYFYQLKANGIQSTKRMLLLR